MVAMMAAEAQGQIADIRIEDPVWEAHLDNLPNIVETVFGGAATRTLKGSVDLLLTNDAEMHALNKTWRGKDKPTDVLSFPSDEEGENPFLGDIALGFGVFSTDAEKMGKSLKAHFSHLLVHGYLHLLGYDHQNEEDAQEMESLEIQILADLGISDPYRSEKQK